jgi:hypothetical protein
MYSEPLRQRSPETLSQRLGARLHAPHQNRPLGGRVLLGRRDPVAAVAVGLDQRRPVRLGLRKILRLEGGRRQTDPDRADQAPSLPARQIGGGTSAELREKRVHRLQIHAGLGLRWLVGLSTRRYPDDGERHEKRSGSAPLAALRRFDHRIFPG